MKRQFILLSFILFFFLVFYTLYYYFSMNLGDKLLRIDANESEYTNLVYSPEEPIDPEVNQFFTYNSFAMLKNAEIQFSESLTDIEQSFGLPIELETGDVINNRYFVAFAGLLSNDYRQTISRSLRETFGSREHETLVENIQTKEDDIGVYTHFQQKHNFVRHFYLNSDPFLFKGEDVRSYKFRSERFADPVFVANLNSDNFVLRFEINEGKEEVFMAVCQPGESLQATYDSMLAGIAAFDERRIEMEDRIFIPIINVDIAGQMAPLEEALNAAFAISRVRFKFSVKQKDFSLLPSSRLGRGSENEGDLFKFDRPFFIAIRNKDNEKAYFMAWIANSEVLN